MKKTIFITGIGGTLGKAFARRLKDEYEVFGCDNSEWAVAAFDIPGVTVRYMDFTDWRFCDDPCDIVIHLAAAKHVNLGEENVETFINNNINKTLKLFKEAYKYNTDVIFVSSDKAVEPISLYGVTKFVGEYLARHFNFSITRLGNILASSGSVIPLWEEKILKGEPIPITDERMVRYWIEDYEAVDQIWDMYKAGKKLIIPQCKKVRLMDLLTEVLKRHDKTIDDVEVEVIGLRPGEKLEEKLKWDTEES
jgi:FlaA1/EpsC-like NDP-sugar epimerase